jgi:LysM domain
MASLSAHLRRAGDHGALRFHPECPVCRDERLAGTLPTDALVSRRTQALFAASVLALSSAPPTAALAQEPDQEQEGSAAPDQAVVSDPAADPDFDPGGETTDLPFDAGPAPSAPVAAEVDDDETGALELEPATNEEAPIAEAGEGSTAPAAEQQAPSPTGPTQPPAPTPPATPEPAEPAPVASDPSATLGPAESEPGTRTHPREDTRNRPRRSDAKARSESPAASPAPEPAAATEPSETTIYITQEPTVSRAVSAPAEGRAARSGDRTHVVLPGESLWSISQDVLGDGASVAKIARKVNRLWELNSERIGTGSPHLLMVGTKLVLR